MKIKERDGEVVDVYAVYFIGGDVNFLGMPKNYGGLSAFSAREVEIVESEMKYNSIYFKNNGYGIYHWALIKEKLLDDLLELDETAYKRFLEIVKAEGLVDPDFY
ncbi:MULTISPECIES: hypothetical protein [Klebsiella]|uniref:Uncharacterized protein n=1 Tax=Klebsiella pasteurii TaxID=2587529 RepID=A0A9Q9UMD5_9ENTR|nr:MULTISPECIES: hypothetical protein [Klebsiella]MBZ7662218.1 hypothetical protein [Klebsiella grimontii]MDD9664276.1 hypothetical protein [Klebsiella pasteurii]MDD9669745.1 hypothetical protein [Klebsiella pasteurii]MDD9685923.1 hypothetical protein [Klebsiella pasteurii]MDM4221537.1 hypothetical protein [Klebsiella pasteurii]